MLKINTAKPQALFSIAATRSLEHDLQKNLPPHTLMQRAGLATAQLALAIAPHARSIWIACGPGNNGGDGLEAASRLKKLGKDVVVTWLGTAAQATPDSLASHQQAMQAGVTFADSPPQDFDLCIDALLGIGATDRAPLGVMSDWIMCMNHSGQAILSVDLPTGLNADTGRVCEPHVCATHTLCLLTLKPGLYTAHGRDVCGDVWLADLGLDPGNTVFLNPSAWLTANPAPLKRLHASHKGSYGDVAIVGGAPGMTGAALLAACAALHAGAGRVFVSLLDTNALQVDITQPELMFRPLKELNLADMVLVVGCGGGKQIEAAMSTLLSAPSPLVLDADALNAVAQNKLWQSMLIKRQENAWVTVLTPHPLEAARLLNTTVEAIQSNRLLAAQQLADHFGCIAVLKGSGTVICAPGQIPFINPTGNGKLATAGSGDVLAGLLGTQLAAGHSALTAARDAVFHHGEAADLWPAGQALCAGALAKLL